MPSEAASSISAVGRSRPVPLGPPHDHHGQRRARRRVAPRSAASAREQHVGRLERLDPADEGDDVPGHRQAEPRRARARPRSTPPATARSGPGRRRAAPRTARAGSAPYRAIRSCASNAGVGDQPVGLGDDLLLADHPGQRLGPVAGGELRVLDLGQGVRGVHQRHAPALPGQPADLAGEPVVRVDQVVVARRVGRLGAQHAVGERAQLGRQVLLGEALERARR